MWVRALIKLEPGGGRGWMWREVPCVLVEPRSEAAQSVRPRGAADSPVRVRAATPKCDSPRNSDGKLAPIRPAVPLRCGRVPQVVCAGCLELQPGGRCVRACVRVCVCVCVNWSRDRSRGVKPKCGAAGCDAAAECVCVCVWGGGGGDVMGSGPCGLLWSGRPSAAVSGDSNVLQEAVVKTTAGLRESCLNGARGDGAELVQTHLSRPTLRFLIVQNVVLLRTSGVHMHSHARRQCGCVLG